METRSTRSSIPFELSVSLLSSSLSPQSLILHYATEPRGWSCLHGIEGYQNLCSSLTITNNVFEKAGNGPSAGMNQQKRDTTDDTHTANQWVRLSLFSSLSTRR